MGMVRVLLAIAVVFQHTYGTLFDGGYIAVQLFFIVSGFVISFILVEQQSYPTPGAFYKNRVLRLFPIYYVVAIGSLVFYMTLPLITGNPTSFQEVYQSIDIVGQALLVFGNLFILGQDWVMFTAVHDGVVHFHHDFQDSEVPVWRGLLVPPAWSLSVGLVFYLIAPFVLPRFRLLLTLLILSILVRLLLHGLGLATLEQWNYWFFPAELAFFLVGALAHQLGLPLARRLGLLTQAMTRGVTWAMVGGVMVFVTFDVDLPRFVTIVIFLAALPFMFHFQSFSHWDRWIGELGYPIYVVHWIIMVAVNYAWDILGPVPGYQGMDETLLVVALSVVAALLLKRIVGDPIEAARDRLRQTA